MGLKELIGLGFGCCRGRKRGIGEDEGVVRVFSEGDFG